MNKKLTTLEDLFKDFGFVAISKDRNGRIYGNITAPRKDEECWTCPGKDFELTDLFEIPEFDGVEWEKSLRYGLIEPNKENFKMDAKVYIRENPSKKWRKAHLASFEPENINLNYFGVWESGQTSFTCDEDYNLIKYYPNCKFAAEEL